MAQSLAQVWLHIIFSTKNRYPFLRDPEHLAGMHAYLGAACRDMRCPARIVNGTADHVHVLCSLWRSVAVADLMRRIKEPSSKWAKTKPGMMTKFAWQAGYAAFSVSASRLQAVHRYILNQERHHRKISFQEELRRFLDEYGIDYDERRLWD